MKNRLIVEECLNYGHAYRDMPSELEEGREVCVHCDAQRYYPRYGMEVVTQTGAEFSRWIVLEGRSVGAAYSAARRRGLVPVMAKPATREAYERLQPL